MTRVEMKGKGEFPLRPESGLYMRLLQDGRSDDGHVWTARLQASESDELMMTEVRPGRLTDDCMADGVP